MMREHPFFSIILPVYNGEETLPHALNAVLAQTFSRFELIAVDDGSTDGTARLLKEAADCDARIRVVTLPENRGLGAARNAGIAESAGETLIFMDADDVVDANLYELLYDTLQKTPSDLVVFGVRESYIGKDGALLNERIITPNGAAFTGRRSILTEAANLEALTLFGYAWNKAYAARLVNERELRFQNAVLIEDFLFNLDFIRAAESMITLEAAPYTYHIRNAGSLTARFEAQYYPVHRERIELLYEALRRESALNENSQRMLANRYARYVTSAAARNFEPESGLNRSGRRAFLCAVFEDALYAKLRPFMGGFAGMIVRSRRASWLGAFAFCSRFLRRRLPAVFAKVKKYAR